MSCQQENDREEFSLDFLHTDVVECQILQKKIKIKQAMMKDHTFPRSH